jgi:hypothetical protein
MLWYCIRSVYVTGSMVYTAVLYRKLCVTVLILYFMRCVKSSRASMYYLFGTPVMKNLHAVCTN